MKVRSIQFLRAIAILLVLYIHALDMGASTGPSLQWSFFHLPYFGSVGVDIFFVISGFIITWSAGRYLGSREALRFLRNRFLRLIPVYWIATALFLAIQLHHWLKGDPSFLRSPLLIAKTIILLPVFDKTYFVLPLLQQAWTLSFEWLFYLIFFLSIFLSIRRKEIFLFATILAAVIIGRLLQPTDLRLIFLANPILLEFLLGIALCRCYTRLKVTRPLAATMLITAILIFSYEIANGFGDIYLNDYTLNGQLSMTRFLVWGIPSALLVGGCIFLEKNASLVSLWNNRMISFIGDASYSIYLTHVSIFGLCGAVFTRTGYFLNHDLAVFVLMLLAIIGGGAFYKWVEVPVLNASAKYRSPKKMAAA
jgi:peptidoglycan/LPS O-acetylase OafA/YrhL